MSKEQVAPINHSSGSATASTIGGATWGGFKAGVGTVLLWVAAFTVLGAYVGAGLATGGWSIALGGLGAVLGFGVGSGTSWLPGSIATALGAFSGGSRAAQQVAQEREAAQVMQAQIAMAGRGPSQSYSADPRFNQASSQIQADSAQNDGRLAQMERARAQ